jgi:hypothetical protein
VLLDVSGLGLGRTIQRVPLEEIIRDVLHNTV